MLQNEHTVRAAWGLYRPGIQLLHTLNPVVLVILPLTQSVHTVAPANAYLPAAHGAQTLKPADPPNLPASQLRHALSPELAPYLPTMQSVHDKFALGEYLPGTQFVQVVAFRVGYAPGLQQTPVTEMEFLPTSQVEHEVEPATA